MARRRPLDVRQILAWADAHYSRTGQYPDTTCGWLVDAPVENWFYIDSNLRSGARGLPSGWSLAQLLDELRGKRNVQDLPPHTIERILAWADAHYQTTGDWPLDVSGPVADAPEENWLAIDMALRVGNRGLSGGSSLAMVLREERGVQRKRYRRPIAHGRPKSRSAPDDDRGQMWLEIARLRAGRVPLDFTFEQILAWADEFFARQGEWPSRDDGLIVGTEGETWAAVEAALIHGTRGLPGDCSIAQLLTEHRGVRNLKRLPPLSVEQILQWADAHRDRTGDWPAVMSGPIELSEETWAGIDYSLRAGRRGLPCGSSLAQLLDDHRGTHRAQNPTPLSTDLILEWADAWYQRHGRWPTDHSGAVPESPGDTWNAIGRALRDGLRGLAGDTSLVELLAENRGKRNRAALPPLTEAQILAWADAFYARYAKWPTQTSGPVEEAPGEKWGGLDQALGDGRRGLPGGSSLAQLLAQHRGKRNRAALPPLTEEQILAWADAFYTRHGKWPTQNCEAVDEAPGETWHMLNWSLVHGSRDLAGGSSLAKLLAARRGKRNPRALPALTEEQILDWADHYHARHGRWPYKTSGEIEDAPGETWGRVDYFLVTGNRGLLGGSSLFRLLAERRGKRNHAVAPPFTEEQILAWADAYHSRQGRWPTLESGSVTEAPDVTWRAVDGALRRGHRGLPGGSSLAKLLDRCRRKVPVAVGCAVADEAGQSQIAGAPNGDGSPAAPTPARRASATSNSRLVRIRPK